MKAQWLKLAARYEALLLRERWMVAAALLGGIVMIGSALFVEPALKRAQLADRGMAEQRPQLATLQTQLIALQSPGQDPDVAARSELAELKKKLADLGGRFAAMEGTLIPPQRMPNLLEDLIGRNSGLRLLGLRTLPVAPVLDSKSATKRADDGKAADALEQSVGLFKHGVEVKLEGSYQELAAYLARLEKSPLKLLWSSVSLTTDRQPKLVLTLTVFTLSLDRTWLIV